MQPTNGIHTVGDCEEEKFLHMVKPTTQWMKTFNEDQKLLSKTNGKLIGESMTATPMVVQEETSNRKVAARLLLQTKFGRLPAVDTEGKLVGIITEGNVVRALQFKRASEK